MTPAQTADLADAVAADLAFAVGQLSELIGGGSEETNALHGLRAVLARAGAMADAIAIAHGRGGWEHSAMHWLFCDYHREAMDISASLLKARLAGGAA